MENNHSGWQNNLAKKIGLARSFVRPTLKCMIQFYGVTPRRAYLLHRPSPHRKFPVRPHKVAGIAAGKFLQIVLMLRLGLPESTRRRNLSDHLAGPQTGSLHVSDRFNRHALLLFAGVVNRRTIAQATVIALAIHRGRVMNLEEKFQNLAVADFRRIENNLDRFRVRSVIAVGGVGHVAAGVTHAGRNDARLLAQQILHAPKTTSSQNRLLRLSAHAFAPLAPESNSLRYAPYPSASISSSGTKRSEAELMQ